MNVLPDSLVGWLIAALLLFWFVGAYNRLVRLRSAALQAYATLDAALLRQLEFVQAQGAADDGSAASGASAASSSHAAASLKAATAQLSALLAATRLRPLDASGMAALATALQVLTAAWQRLHPDAVTIFEADGTLSRPAPMVPGTETPVFPSGTLIAWPEPSAAAEIARNHFNHAVMQYNMAISQFPALLLAWAFRLRPAAPL
jgi:LemA protein